MKSKDPLDNFVYRINEINLEKIFNYETNPSDSIIDISSYHKLSTRALGSYVTLNWNHKHDIDRISEIINSYVLDNTIKKPLNILLIAEPGSGKSHFVNCLSNKLKSINVSSVTYNMATMRNPEDLIQPIERVRNLKVQDKIPILFLDEFDSSPNNYPILLPLLWDGEVHLGHNELKLGKLIIILAGSSNEIKEAKSRIQDLKELQINPKGNSKIIDLLSRINGGFFDIPNLDDRKADKICLTVSLIHNRYDKRIKYVPWSLLMFISETNFRYGVRSIALLIDSLPYSFEKSDRINSNELNFPLDTVKTLKESNLIYHLLPSKKDGDINGLISRWHKIKEKNNLVCILKDEAK